MKVEDAAKAVAQMAQLLVEETYNSVGRRLVQTLQEGASPIFLAGQQDIAVVLDQGIEKALSQYGIDFAAMKAAIMAEGMLAIGDKFHGDA